MNKQGVIFLAGIPVILQILALLGLAGAGLYVADTVGLLGTSTPYGACGIGSFGKPCPMGYQCDNAYFVGGSCQPVQTPFGWWDRLLGSLSLNNLFCGQAGILTPVCNTALPLASVLVAVAVLLLFVLVVIPDKLAIYGAIVLGIIFGAGFYTFIALYWWILIIVGIVAAIIGYKIVEGG